MPSLQLSPLQAWKMMDMFNVTNCHLSIKVFATEHKGFAVPYDLSRNFRIFISSRLMIKFIN